ncbi:hypothetical protein [Streptomyces deccanensis]|uniref:hypothetical protein n=1 Tax=Streptomyces deccanensis TaxID=424188 RepID=UPI001EFC12AD|nr:hypothetical protein [Streptomyces deccanensis]ULR52255.1 hypothetical protein L3078_24860 [Streptomyces deccanensis]
MAILKRPVLPDGPQKDLNAALHDLHLRAGLPSVRDLEVRIGGPGIAGRSRIHDAFTNGRLPAWGLLQVLVSALAQTVPGSDTAAEEGRIYQLWLAASGRTTSQKPEKQPALESRRTLLVPAEQSRRAILAMRVEWANPAALKVETRRGLREWVGKALDDIGWPSTGEHRRNDSAGSTIILNASSESPNLTVATFLSALDSEMEYLRLMTSAHAAGSIKLKFVAVNDPAASSHEESMWLLGALLSVAFEAFWSSSAGPVPAMVHGIDTREGQLPGSWAKYTTCVNFEGIQRTLSLLERGNSDDPWSAPF